MIEYTIEDNIITFVDGDYTTFFNLRDICIATKFLIYAPDQWTIWISFSNGEKITLGNFSSTQIDKLFKELKEWIKL